MIAAGTPWIFYRSPLAFLPEIICFISLFLGAITFSAIYPQTIQSVSFGPVKFSLSLGAIFPLVFGAYLLHQLYNSRYIVGADSVRATHGILSFIRHDNEISVADIRGVEIDRSIWGRIFNVGTIEIGTAAHQAKEITIAHVYDPSLIRNVILERKKMVLQLGRTRPERETADD